MATQRSAPPQRTLRILLIEDDPADAAWIQDLIKERCPTSEVVHRASLPEAISALAQRPIDAVFISVRPDGGGASIQDCREVVRRAGGRSVVALVDLAEMAHVAEIRATGVELVYRKHPIMRTAQLRKQRMREKWQAIVRLDRARPTISSLDR
jgi:DNA-binding NarL/FixJ family response regulator